jgi:hypothetical protein
MKPNNFPLRPSLDGSEEIYTQTSGTSQKFTLEQAKSFISEPTDITYSELYNKVVNGELVAGSWYRLTDYKSVNFLNGWLTANQNPTPTDPNFDPQEIYEGETEVLILQATSPYEIAEIGYSETFNGDIVQYEPFTNKIGVTIPNGIYNGELLPDETEISGFDLQWDGTNVYFNMPTGYPALFGHYFYLYAEFQELANGQPISSITPNLSLSGDVTGLSGTYNLLIPTTLTGIGSGLVLDVTVKSGSISVNSISNYGDNYAIGDTLLIQGTDIGGTDANNVTITVLAVDTESGSYYQEGVFEPLTPNISTAQYPQTFEDSYGKNAPKTLSRLKVEDEGMKVILLDLTEEDYDNYIADTLYVETVYALGDAYGWVTRRIDTFRNVDVPFDFRGRKYRRFEVDLSSINSSLGTGYWGIGDDFLGQGTTGSYHDFKCFDNENQWAYNIKWNDMGGADMYTRGYNDNFVCLGLFDNTVLGSVCYNNTIFECSLNKIDGNFINNVINISFADNEIGYSFMDNTIGNNFIANKVSSDFYSNTILDNFQYNLINSSPSITDFSSATYVYGSYTCTIFKNSAGTLRLSYIDGTDTIQYTAINA